MQSVASLALDLFEVRYFNVAGLTVLLYDHFLLLSREVQYIWMAKSSWFKWLFLFSRYSVPVYIFINALALGPIPKNLSLQFCQNWISATAILPASSLAILNIFVAQRIYVLWGFNKTVLKLAFFGIGTAYTVCFIVGIEVIIQLFPFITHNSIVISCVPQNVPKLFVVGLGVPLYLEVMNLLLLCINALHRPRHLQTHIVKQLYLDGVIYFLVITVFRVLNVVALTGVAFSEGNQTLFGFFLWAMAPAIVHRMILTLNDKVDNELKGNLRLYVREPWPALSRDSITVLYMPSNDQRFEFTEETYRFTDSVF